MPESSFLSFESKCMNFRLEYWVMYSFCINFHVFGLDFTGGLGVVLFLGFILFGLGMKRSGYIGYFLYPDFSAGGTGVASFVPDFWVSEFDAKLFILYFSLDLPL